MRLIQILVVPAVLFIIMLFGLVGALLVDDGREYLGVIAVGAFIPVFIYVLWISPRTRRAKKQS